MAFYRKRPVIVEAFRYYASEKPDWFTDALITMDIIDYQTHCEIRTLEGTMRGEIGDYIIKGIAGEIYPCKPDIFEASYEEVENIL